MAMPSVKKMCITPK